MSEWTTTTLKDICEPMNGIWKGVKEPFISAKILRATNFSKDCKLKLDDVAIIDVEKKKLDSRRLQRGDIVVEKSGGGPNQPVGRVILFNLDDGDYSFCNFTSALRIKDKSKVLPEFLYKYLVYLYFEGETEKYQSNLVGFRNLDFKGYTSMVVRFPNTISEQQRIVDLLDKEFEKIDRLRSNAELNLQHAKDLFQAALAKELEPKEGWRWVRLNDLYNFIDYRGSTPTKLSEGIPLITAKNVKVGYLDYTIKDFIAEEEYHNRQSRGISHRGDILFTTEAPLGNVAIADKEVFSAGQRVITFQQYSSSEKTLNNKFYLYFFLSKRFQDELKEQATGLTAQGIKASRLKEILVPYLDIQAQQSIVSTLDELNAKCKVLQENYTKTIALCNDLKQALLRKAFNGEL